MIQEVNIKKALVVLSPDLISPEEALESALLKRAMSLAKSANCKLELLHVCYDGKFDFGLFGSRNDLRKMQRKLTDRDATIVAEMAARLSQAGVDVHYEVRWDHPRTDAILRKIAESKPDVVMKQAREHSFVLGIKSNTDWDLARRSPAHVWLVNDERHDISSLLAAVGSRIEDELDVTTGIDHHIMRTARDIADTFKAEVYPVNAYQIATTDTLPVSMAEASAPVLVHAEDIAEQRGKIIRRHTNAVHALAQLFLINPDNIHVLEGHPSQVIPEVAEQVDADMIVLGASNIGRLERVVSAVTVEPVIAESNSDIFVVRDHDDEKIPDARSQPIYGVPKYNIEQAIMEPESTFDSPHDVVSLHEVSLALRRRILQAWEYDLRAAMVAENEGGPPREIDIASLDDIRAAIDELAAEKSSSQDRPGRFGAASG